MTPQTLNQKLTAAHIPPDLIDKIEQMTAQSKSNP
ncbi:MAG: hypothetical protein UT85_C0031G0001, partial [Candidatus Levybacteria bacterium GW2011_GWA2_40_16]